MRIYLVVMDETPEASVALRFAGRRALKTGGGVQILVPIAPIEFMGVGGVQATMEEEARQHAEGLAASAAGLLAGEVGLQPSIVVDTGDGVTLVRRTLAADADIAALVLGAAAIGVPGPLVAHFAGVEAGQLPCPIMIVPGGLDAEALDRVS